MGSHAYMQRYEIHRQLLRSYQIARIPFPIAIDVSSLHLVVGASHPKPPPPPKKKILLRNYTKSCLYPFGVESAVKLPQSPPNRDPNRGGSHTILPYNLSLMARSTVKHGAIIRERS